MTATLTVTEERPVAPLVDHRTGDPAEQLRADLTRFRAAGRDFDSAWAHAFGRVRWPHDTAHRRAWKAILEGDRHAWRAAYCGETPSTIIAVLAQLA